MKKTKIILSVALISVILFACFGLLGYFLIGTMRRSGLRADAREAFAAEDWKKAEKLLNEYVRLDPDSEEDYVRLAQVYNHFGNTGEEMHSWYRACVLNPLEPEYWDNYTKSAMNARDFGHLYASLNRKNQLGGDLAPKDRILYIICLAVTNRDKEAEKFYETMLKEDPEAFRKDSLARFAEFLVFFDKHTDTELTNFINEGINSDDPFIRLESILLCVTALDDSEGNDGSVLKQKESMLKQAVALNRFAATPFLAVFYFSRLKFSSVIETAEPYLADIDNLPLSVLYAESCVYNGHPEKLKPLVEHYRSLGQKYRMYAAYFEALIDFSQGVEKNDDLVRHMQEAGGVVRSDLANLMNLQIALNNDDEENVVGTLETIMSKPPFYDLRDRACSAVHHYMEHRIREKPALADDPRMVKLAQLISGSGNTDPFLMRIMVSDQRKRNMLTRQFLQENLDAFPYDPYLLEAAAEFELFNGNPEQCLKYTERYYALKEEKRSTAFGFLHMLALELMGKIDEAAKEYTALVDNTEMDRGILFRYLRFCKNYERQTELITMAERLKASSVPELKALAPFFQAEALILQGRQDEALSLLETAKTDQPDFALHAANMFSSNDVLDQALSRYLALVGRHPDKRLILANIAEVYLAKEMKTEALSYAKQAWDTNPEDALAQFVYAKMLAANERYQDAEKIFRIHYREGEQPSDEFRKLWTDIMLHCVQEDFANGYFSRALDHANRYLMFFPDDPAFREFKARAEQELKKTQEPTSPEQPQ